MDWLWVVLLVLVLGATLGLAVYVAPAVFSEVGWRRYWQERREQRRTHQGLGWYRRQERSRRKRVRQLRRQIRAQHGWVGKPRLVPAT